MATGRMALLEHLGNAAAGGDVDFLRTAVKTLAEVLMEVEVAAKLGAELRSGDGRPARPPRRGHRPQGRELSAAGQATGGAHRREGALTCSCFDR
jgi:hypothetical protein